MNVDIEEVKKIFKEEEDKINDWARKSNLSEDMKFFDKVQNLNRKNVITFFDITHFFADYGNTRYAFYANREDEISMDPTHVFIRALESGKGTENIPQFQELVNELVDVNSPLIDYIIARNPNVSEETRIKIAQKENVEAIILTELAKTTKNVKLLEALISNDDETSKYDDVRIAVLNNPVFSTSEKFNEYFTGCIERFSIYELKRLKNIPETCKEDYDYFTRLRSIEDCMSGAFDRMEYARNCGEDSVYDDASNEYNELQAEYDKLKSQRMQK